MLLRISRLITLIAFASCVFAVSSECHAEHEGRVQILLLGDSTTIGSVCRITNPAGPHLEQVIQVLLAAEKDMPPVNVINQGRDGEFIHGLLTNGRYDKDIAKLPGIDFVFIRYGLNDNSRREDFVNNFPKDFQELIARLRKDFPKATLIPTTIIPYISAETDAKINGLITKAAEDEKLSLFDVYTRYQAELGHGQNMLNYRRYLLEKIPEQHRAWVKPFTRGNSVVVMDNQLDAHFRDLPGWFSDRHPNLAGYHVIGDETAKYLAKIIREKKNPPAATEKKDAPEKKEATEKKDTPAEKPAEKPPAEKPEVKPEEKKEDKPEVKPEEKKGEAPEEKKESTDEKKEAPEEKKDTP